MNNINDRIKALEDRNKNVDKNKAWETSLVRRALITLVTYFTVLGYLVVIDAEKPVVSAVVPAIGYFLSTLVVRAVKEQWMSRRSN